MVQNKVVIRYQDDRIMKGFTADFLPNKDVFHLTPIDEPNAKTMEVRLGELKALFFVKDPKGDPKHHESNIFDASKPPAGRKIKVTFKDGETLVGTTQGYQPNRPGFFVVPADPKSNNERCFVITAATRTVAFV